MARQTTRVVVGLMLLALIACAHAAMHDKKRGFKVCALLLRAAASGPPAQEPPRTSQDMPAGPPLQTPAGLLDLPHPPATLSSPRPRRRAAADAAGERGAGEPVCVGPQPRRRAVQAQEQGGDEEAPRGGGSGRAAGRPPCSPAGCLSHGGGTAGRARQPGSPTCARPPAARPCCCCAQYVKFKEWRQKHAAGDESAGSAYAGKIPHDILHHITTTDHEDL
jgi:hypothetical protein